MDTKMDNSEVQISDSSNNEPLSGMKVLSWLNSSLAKVQLRTGKTAWLPLASPEVATHSTQRRESSNSAIQESDNGGLGRAHEKNTAHKASDYASATHKLEENQHSEGRHVHSCVQLNSSNTERSVAQRHEINSYAEVSGDMDVDCTETTDVSGTLRWKMNFQFPQLPPLRDANDIVQVLTYFRTMVARRSQHSFGWSSWLDIRLPGIDPSKQQSSELHRIVKVPSGKHIEFHPSLLDSMSFPLSLAYGLYSHPAVEKLLNGASSDLYVLVAGASLKAEQRLCRRSEAFHELQYILQPLCQIFGYRNVRLIFVGPEVKDAEESKLIEGNAKLKLPTIYSKFFSSKVEEYLSRNTVLKPSNCVCIGYNCGFGNRYIELRKSWLPSIKALLSRGLYCMFTSVNYTEDLKGELIVMQQLKAKRILSPLRNPFHMASTFVQEDNDSCKSSGSETCCGNSYLYGVQGYE